MIQIDGSKLFLDKTYADVTFEVDGQEIPGHRLILGQACSYFDKLLYRDFEESKSKRVQITVTSSKVFKEVIRFIYLGQLEFYEWQIDDLLALISVAHEYQFQPLFCEIMKALEQKSVDFDSYNLAVSAATIYESNALKTMCDLFVSKKVEDFLRCKDLEKFTAEFICSMFDSPKISNCDQDKLRGAIYKWQENDSVTKISSVFPKICWEKVSPKIIAMMAKEFVSVVQNADEWKFWKQMSTAFEEPPKSMAPVASGTKELTDHIVKVDSLVHLKIHKFSFSSYNCKGTLFCDLCCDNLVFTFGKDDKFVEIPVKRIEFETSVQMKIQRIAGVSLDYKEVCTVVSEQSSENNWFKYTSSFSDVTKVRTIGVISESIRRSAK